jgi:hypothetical protein
MNTSTAFDMMMGAGLGLLLYGLMLLAIEWLARRNQR